MNTSEVRTLLPIKEKSGRWIYPTEIVTQEDDPEEDDMEQQSEDVSMDEMETEEASSTRPNFLERYTNEQQKLKKVKIKIGVLCSSITQDPENNMSSLKDLVNMLHKPSTKLIVTEKKILAISLLHVFKDILPGYKIRVHQEGNKKVKLKKETKVLLNYETSMLRYYKKYLDCLQDMANGIRGKKKRLSVIEKKALCELASVAARCLCELLVSRYYFNYCKTIVNIIVPLACSRESEIRSLCCDGIEALYKADKLGETSLEAVKQTVRVVKERKFCVPAELLRTFLCLKLQDAKMEKKEKTDMKKVRKQLNMMSRKEKRDKKKMRVLESQLRETEAQENREAKSRIQTETLKKVFWVYFHILKDDAKMVLLAPALEGLSTFAQLINLEFFDDLSSVLSSLMANMNLSNIEKLHCMHTVFTILSGYAESLNVDPQALYSHLYNILLELQISTNTDDFQMALRCIDLMIIKRKRKITFNRLLAFTKRLCTVSLHGPVYFTLAALATVRLMLLNNKNSDILLDTENSIGSGGYLPELEDPEYCNPGSTVLWDLHALVQHYNPAISSYAKHILHGCPLQGKPHLPDNLSKFSPQELFQTFSGTDEMNGIFPDSSKR